MVCLESGLVLNAGNIGDYSYILPYIRYCNHDRYFEYWQLKRRKIRDYEFIYVVDGAGRFILEDREYTVKEDDLLLLQPDSEHEAESLTTQFSFLCLHFDIYVSEKASLVQLPDKPIFEAIPADPIKYSKCRLEMPELISCKCIPSFQMIFKRIINESKNRPKGYNTMMKSLFTEMLFTLMREIGQPSGPKHIPEEINQALEYINRNFGKKITLTDISGHVHLQAAYFSTLFKKYMGVNFSEYLKRKRLLEAKSLLLNTDRKIEDIALSTGFYDIHHFSNLFKKYEGLTPSEYSQLKIQKD